MQHSSIRALFTCTMLIHGGETMEWLELINENLSGIGSVIFLLLGASLTYWFNARQTKTVAHLTYRENNIVVPAIAHIDDLVSLVSLYYWKTKDGNAGMFVTKDKLDEIRMKDGIIRTRIRALNNENIYNEYKRLIERFFSFMQVLQSHQNNQNIIDMARDEVEIQASKLIDLLKPNL
jgi:hypothetical protein